MFLKMFYFFQYIKLRSWWFRRQADQRYEAWQRDRLRGFEADNSKNKKSNDVERQGQNPQPGTSGRHHQNLRPGTSRRHQKKSASFDPLDKPRREWNKAMKEEYAAKFQKWKSLGKDCF